MNKGVIAGIIAVIFIATGAYVVMNNDDEATDQVSPQSNQNVQEPESINGEQATIPQTDNPGAYVEYSDEIVAQSADTERVLFFHAEWCSVCNFYEDRIERDGVPEGITIIKADYDTEDALKDQYGITVQSTFVWLDENGEARQTWPFANGLSEPQNLYDTVLAG
jgi:hypothetical protein